MTGIGNNLEGAEPRGSYIFLNDTTWVHGRHNFRFGVEVRKYYYTQVWNWGASGSYTFNNQTTADPNALGSTGYAFASFLLGDTGSAGLSDGFSIRDW